MPRQARIVLPGVPLHLIQRGNNRQACFYVDDDYQRYLEWLRTYASDNGCAIHAYVLMTNHVHLLLSSATAGGVGGMMKRLGQRYVQYVNRTYQRSGTLWEGRFRSCLTQEESYVMGCYRYIELNPVRAGMVEHPGDYRWSSYRANAQGEADDRVQAHACYQALAPDAGNRQAAYRALFRHQLDDGLVDEIRSATNGNYVLGTSRFQDEVANALGRRVTRGRAGRPKKKRTDADDGELLRDG
jgi:putative transposase